MYIKQKWESIHINFVLLENKQYRQPGRVATCYRYQKKGFSSEEQSLLTTKSLTAVLMNLGPKAQASLVNTKHQSIPLLFLSFRKDPRWKTKLLLDEFGLADDAREDWPIWVKRIFQTETKVLGRPILHVELLFLSSPSLSWRLTIPRFYGEVYVWYSNTITFYSLDVGSIWARMISRISFFFYEVPLIFKILYSFIQSFDIGDRHYAR